MRRAYSLLVRAFSTPRHVLTGCQDHESLLSHHASLYDIEVLAAGHWYDVLGAKTTFPNADTSGLDVAN